MNVADDIRKLGFRRWYERQLIEGFAYMVTAFLALILLLAGYESLDQLRSMPGFYLTVFVAAAAAGMLTIVGFRRFGVLLSRAEQFANDAECPQCKAWGKFDVVSMESVSEDDPVESGRPHWLRVRCRKCDNGWRIG
jgi:hypothetical protein